MKLQRFALAVAGASLLAAAATTGPAGAVTTADPNRARSAESAAAVQRQSANAAAAACSMLLGWIKTDGSSPAAMITAGSPPKTEVQKPLPIFPFRASATWYFVDEPNNGFFTGLVLQGANLYAGKFTAETGKPYQVSARKIGGGWAGFSSIATSNYAQARPRHHYLYGLHANGRLYRYASSGGVFRALGSFGGFSSFKAMAVISETATYDTLLMTTKAGALYTIRIPVAASTKPVVKQVRKAGWSSFETMVPQRCGQRGTLLTALDHNTDSGFLYAVGQAVGLSTPIRSLGKLTAKFDGATHFLMTNATGPQLLGE